MQCTWLIQHRTLGKPEDPDASGSEQGCIPNHRGNFSVRTREPPPNLVLRGKALACTSMGITIAHAGWSNPGVNISLNVCVRAVDDAAIPKWFVLPVAMPARPHSLSRNHGSFESMVTLATRGQDLERAWHHLGDAERRTFQFRATISISVACKAYTFFAYSPHFVVVADPDERAVRPGAIAEDDIESDTYDEIFSTQEDFVSVPYPAAAAEGQESSEDQDVVDHRDEWESIASARRQLQRERAEIEAERKRLTDSWERLYREEEENHKNQQDFLSRLLANFADTRDLFSDINKRCIKRQRETTLEEDKAAPEILPFRFDGCPFAVLGMDQPDRHFVLHVDVATAVEKAFTKRKSKIRLELAREPADAVKQQMFHLQRCRQWLLWQVGPYLEYVRSHKPLTHKTADEALCTISKSL
ncbi:hypothetical protein QKT49_gp099 [Acanthamoeba castellanii medusavirus]|uniref:Uncharacterized protein n=1 Tax=Acanthamoeba castellanii medusavirus J1 TaxID=3114988 RepID=A0A3T1CWQ1_9VIRU|nr:hypothetical protein QKT49_gp099 [Acanthamoeba castellanii medusavirus]BBI30239.1 hypothetical protein [Acanthamoeba castellanii medusavirus J1]